MCDIDGFKDLDFLEQASAINAIEAERDKKKLPFLLALLRDPVDDEAVDTLVQSALTALLAEDDEEVLRGLMGDEPALKRICIRVAGRTGMAETSAMLAKIAYSDPDPDTLHDVLNAMAMIKSSLFLPVFRREMDSPDPVVASLCVHMIGAYKDQESLPILEQLLLDNESEDRLGLCDTTTWSAIDALATMATDESLSILARFLHHGCPAARRLIHEALAEVGQEAVPFVAEILRDGDNDERLMAANVLGFIGGKAAAEPLMAALDSPGRTQPLAFAAYEAMGSVATRKSLSRLLRALEEETDEAALMAAAASLDKLVSWGVARDPDEVVKALCSRPEAIKAAAGARALDLFELVYHDADLAEALVEQIMLTLDPKTMDIFRHRLNHMPGDRAKRHAAMLMPPDMGRSRTRLLAVDDSAAMRSFYRQTGSEMGMDVAAAEDGKEAWEKLEDGYVPDVMVVDLNMPNMDGIELTTRVRSNPSLARIPVIMATTESERTQATLAREAGVTAFLVKPFEARVLQHRLSRYILKLES